MGFWKHNWWWWLFTIAIFHQVVQKVFSVHIPFVHSYLDDIICMPLFLAIWNWERQYWWGSSPLMLAEILVFVLVVFIGFEIIVPKYDSRFTADNWDGLAYLAGAAFYWWLAKDELV